MSDEQSTGGMPAAEIVTAKITEDGAPAGMPIGDMNAPRSGMMPGEEPAMDESHAGNMPGE